MAARHSRTERAISLRLACWKADGVRGRKLELENSLNQKGVDTCLLRLSLTIVKPSGLPIISATARKTDSRVRYSHSGPPLYSPLLSAHSRPDRPGGYCHPSYNGRQTGEHPCSLPLPIPLTNRSGPVGMFRWGNAGLDGRRPQRQTRRLDRAAEHKTGETPA